MNRIELQKSIDENIHLVFSRSGGNGGQNVNKVNTRVQAFVSLEKLEGLTPEEKEQIKAKLRNKINKEGDFFVIVEEERTQERNRAIAIQRLLTSIEGAALIPKKRKKTKPTKASKEKRLKSKKLHALVKQGRNSIKGFD